ncbi:MAG: hypothetical protein ACI86X_000273 [Moritella sp.]|jgi:hypothetical protein
MSAERVQQAIQLIDEINLCDPVSENVNGTMQPKEWLYGIRMSECLAEFAPDASEALQIAARAQHIKRWSIPRVDYPLGREGYNQWRQELGRLHATEAAKIAQQVGCSAADVQAIGRMLRKEKLKRDPEVQALEDVICLVFLKYYFTAFTDKHSPEKLLVIVKKTWAKMSEKGHSAALNLPFTAAQQALFAQALHS